MTPQHFEEVHNLRIEIVELVGIFCEFLLDFGDVLFKLWKRARRSTPLCERSDLAQLPAGAVDSARSAATSVICSISHFRSHFVSVAESVIRRVQLPH